MKKHIWLKIYALAIEGCPAKKIVQLTGVEKSQVSRIIKALLNNGFLVCVNPNDRVKFYESTTKKLNRRACQILATNGQEKTTQLSYGGYTDSATRVHGIMFKSRVLSWKKRVRWDYSWQTNGSVHYLLRVDGVTFIRHKSKKCDTLCLVVPDMLWNVSQKGSVTKAVSRKARCLMGDFSARYGIRLTGFHECAGTSYAIPVRNVELVRLAQSKTVDFGDGILLDASHGTPEFEAPLNVMKELLSLPVRVDKLEKEMIMVQKAIVDMAGIIKQMKSMVEDMHGMFNQPSRPDNKEDVT